MRLFVGNLVIVVVALGVAGTASYLAGNAQYLRVTSAYQDNLCLLAVHHVEDLWPLSDEAMDHVCKEFLKTSPDDATAPHAPTVERGVPARLTVVALDGAVLGDSHGQPREMENHRAEDRPEVLAALDGRSGVDVRQSETLAVEYRYVAKPVRKDGNVVGVVRIATPVLAVLENQAVLRDGVVWGSVVAIVVFALIGVLINWVWYVPLKRITEVAGRISSGDLTTDARVFGSDELAELSRALNTMRDNLAAQIQTTTAQREHLTQVVGNLREGVVAVDADGRIDLMNAAARHLLAHGRDDEVAGREIENVIGVVRVVDAYDECRRAGGAVDRQIEIQVGADSRHLDVHAAPLTRGPTVTGGVLIVVRDVTELVRTAMIKTEFVANASHELRTPLATLRAALDALEPGDFGDREMVARTLGILNRQVERLESLTIDLLNLYEVESAQRKAARDEIRLDVIQEWMRLQFADAVRKKGLALEFDVPRPEDTLTVDRKLVELILQNLVDNAVKFTPAGGRVVCRMARQGGRVVFGVSDSGCGISREDQARVFERFYQADASRSGDARTRGTGLGLAIVKHAADRLDADVTLVSEPGRGTTVSVSVPDHGAVGRA